jgi:hypothetical protein
MATLIPRTLPLSLTGNTAVMMAMPVPNIIALPSPSTTREAMSISTEVAALHNMEETTIISMPVTNIFFLPIISAIRPNGTTKIAAESKKPVTTQPKRAWSGTAKSELMVGSATFTDDARKGVTKEARQMVASTSLLSFIAGEDNGSQVHKAIGISFSALDGENKAIWMKSPEGAADDKMRMIVRARAR